MNAAEKLAQDIIANYKRWPRTSQPNLIGCEGWLVHPELATHRQNSEPQQTDSKTKD